MVWICKGCHFDLKECQCGLLTKMNWSRKEDALRLSDSDLLFLQAMRIKYGAHQSDYAKSL